LSWEGDGVVQVHPAHLDAAGEDQVLAVGDRDLGGGPAQVDVEHDGLVVVGAACEVVEGGERGGELGVHADQFELGLAEAGHELLDHLAADGHADDFDLAGLADGLDLEVAVDEGLRVAAELTGDGGLDGLGGGNALEPGELEVFAEGLRGGDGADGAAAGEPALPDEAREVFELEGEAAARDRGRGARGSRAWRRRRG
jgi:hypothetical protein